MINVGDRVKFCANYMIVDRIDRKNQRAYCHFEEDPNTECDMWLGNFEDIDDEDDSNVSK